MLGIDIPIDLGKKNELVPPAAGRAGQIGLQRKSVVDSGGISRQDAATGEHGGFCGAERSEDGAGGSRVGHTREGPGVLVGTEEEQQLVLSYGAPPSPPHLLHLFFRPSMLQKPT